MRLNHGEPFNESQHASVLLTFVVSGDEAQNILVAKHDGLVNLCFSKPGPFLSGGEDLDCHLFSSPLPPPHLTKATLADAFL